MAENTNSSNGGYGWFRRPKRLRVENIETELVLPTKLALTGILWGELIVLIFWAFFLFWQEVAFVMLFAALYALHIYLLFRAPNPPPRGQVIAITLLYVFITPLSIPVWTAVAQGVSSVSAFLGELIRPMIFIPWWAYCTFVVILGIAYILTERTKELAIGGLVIAAGVAFGFVGLRTSQLLKHGKLAWEFVRWLAVPHLIPPLVFALGLGLHNIYEAMIGAPFPPEIGRVDWERTGLFGLFFPKRIRPAGELEQVVIEPDHVVLEVRRDHEKGKPRIQKGDMPCVIGVPDALAQWGRAYLLGLATFSEKGTYRTDNTTGHKGLCNFGFQQSQFRALRTLWFGQGLIGSKGVGQGYGLTVAGVQFVVEEVVRQLGAGAVPPEYRDFLPRSTRLGDPDIELEDVGPVPIP